MSSAARRRRKPFDVASLYLLIVISACSARPDPDRVLKEQADIAIAAVDLQREYREGASAANRKYKGRLLDVAGTVRSVTDGVSIEPMIIFEPGGEDVVQATFHPSVASRIPGSVQKGQAITLRCEHSGSFGNVLLANCVVR